MGTVAMHRPSPLPRLSRTVGPSIPFPSWLGQRGIAPSRACSCDEPWRQVELLDGVASTHAVAPPRRLLNIASRRRSASLVAVLRRPSRPGGNTDVAREPAGLPRLVRLPLQGQLGPGQMGPDCKSGAPYPDGRRDLPRLGVGTASPVI